MTNTVILLTKTCINSALYNSKFCIGFKLAFYRLTKGIILTSSIIPTSKHICKKILATYEILLCEQYKGMN